MTVEKRITRHGRPERWICKLYGGGTAPVVHMDGVTRTTAKDFGWQRHKEIVLQVGEPLPKRQKKNTVVYYEDDAGWLQRSDEEIAEMDPGGEEIKKAMQAQGMSVEIRPRPAAE